MNREIRQATFGMGLGKRSTTEIFWPTDPSQLNVKGCIYNDTNWIFSPLHNGSYEPTHMHRHCLYRNFSSL